MKKCPYCAEKIQDEAIVCRYCGRDLPKAKEIPKAKAPSKSVESISAQASIWAQGAKASAVITVLYALNQLIEQQTINNLVFRLTIGLLVTFLLFWLICSGIVWLWRKISVASFIGILTIIGLLTVLAFVASTRPSINIPFLASTAILTPTQVPIATPDLWWNNCILGQTITSEKFDTLLYKDICVYGVVTDTFELIATRNVYIIFPLD